MKRSIRTLALLELPRASLEMSQLLLVSPWLLTTPSGDGHGVFVLPGFAATDASTAALRAFLQARGYRTSGWSMGRNFGLRRMGGLDPLLDQYDRFAEKCGGRISIVGWSMGGVYARQIAMRRADSIRQVISLGSPINGNPMQTSVWRVYENVNGGKISREAVERFVSNNRLSPNVPATAIYSRTDGVVPWQIAQEPTSRWSDNIEVSSSHVGLGFNPTVYYLLAERLAQADGQWRKFDRDHWFHRMILSNPPASTELEEQYV